MMLVVAALGGDECWVRNDAAVSAAHMAAHMDDDECETILRALVQAGQLQAGAGMVKLSTMSPG
ncbi:MAG TPA: hypothetical protein VLX90_09750 [Steroidobacteraceae bacterium]|nr:hypothetical protein [Steroidobacteraceae bacterium]